VLPKSSTGTGVHQYYLLPIPHHYHSYLLTLPTCCLLQLALITITLSLYWQKNFHWSPHYDCTAAAYCDAAWVANLYDVAAYHSKCLDPWYNLSEEPVGHIIKPILVNNESDGSANGKIWILSWYTPLFCVLSYLRQFLEKNQRWYCFGKRRISRVDLA
jgi:hypothetical protein